MSIFEIGVKDKWKWNNNRFSKKVLKRLEFGSKVFGGMFALFLLRYAIPFCIDIPILLSNDFVKTEGYVDYIYYKSGTWEKSVFVNNTHIKFFIDVDLAKGDYCVIKYLPNTKIGINVTKFK